MFSGLMFGSKRRGPPVSQAFHAIKDGPQPPGAMPGGGGIFAGINDANRNDPVAISYRAIKGEPTPSSGGAIAGLASAMNGPVRGIADTIKAVANSKHVKRG